MTDRKRHEWRLIILGAVTITYVAFIVLTERILPCDVKGLYLCTIPPLCGFLAYYIYAADQT